MSDPKEVPCDDRAVNRDGKTCRELGMSGSLLCAHCQTPETAGGRKYTCDGECATAALEAKP